GDDRTLVARTVTEEPSAGCWNRAESAASGPVLKVGVGLIPRSAAASYRFVAVTTTRSAPSSATSVTPTISRRWALNACQYCTRPAPGSGLALSFPSPRLEVPSPQLEFCPTSPAFQRLARNKSL